MKRRSFLRGAVLSGAFIALGGASACKQVLEFHPNGGIGEELLLTEKNITKLTQGNNSGKARIAFIADNHKDSDEVESIVDRINEMGDVDFVVHMGDLTDEGLSFEY